MEGSDEQLIIPEPISLHHADDSRALLDAGNPHTLPPGTVVKWVTSPGEHADVPGQLLATRDHAVIRAWAEARFAKPALFKEADPSDPAQALRLVVAERPEIDYDYISWDEWFDRFDAANLVFVFQERTEDGSASDLYEIVPAESVRLLPSP